MKRFSEEYPSSTRHISPLAPPDAPFSGAMYFDALYAYSFDACLGTVITYPNILSDSVRAIRQEQEAERDAMHDGIRMDNI